MYVIIGVLTDLHLEQVLAICRFSTQNESDRFSMIVIMLRQHKCLRFISI